MTVPNSTGKGQDPKGGLQTAITVKTKPYHSERKLGNEWKPEIVGRDLDRYSVTVTGKRWIKYGAWLSAARDPNNFVGQRILIQEITGGKDRRIIAGFHDGELYHSRDVIPVKIENDFPHSNYLLGIINSKLITWYHHRKNPKAQKGLFPKVLVSDLGKLPIRTINLADDADKARHNTLLGTVTYFKLVTVPNSLLIPSSLIPSNSLSGELLAQATVSTPANAAQAGKTPVSQPAPPTVKGDGRK